MKKIALGSVLAIAVLFPLGCGQEKPAAKPVPVILSTPPVDQEAPTVPRATLANTIDPICDMDLEENVRYTAKHDGKEYGFCARYCADEFLKDPKTFIEKLNALPKP